MREPWLRPWAARRGWGSSRSPHLAAQGALRAGWRQAMWGTHLAWAAPAQAATLATPDYDEVPGTQPSYFFFSGDTRNQDGQHTIICEQLTAGK